MKKRETFNKILRIILVLICTCVIPVISFCLVSFFGAENCADIDGINISNDNVLSDEEIDRIAESRRWKKKTMEKEDGWYYFLSMERLEIEFSSYKYSAYLDGCNLKYETLGDNYKLFIDDNGNENHDLITPPLLIFSYSSKDGKKIALEELREINDFFDKKKW